MTKLVTVPGSGPVDVTLVKGNAGETGIAIDGLKLSLLRDGEGLAALLTPKQALLVATTLGDMALEAGADPNPPPPASQSVH